MVVFTKEIAGVVVEDADEVVHQTDVFNEDLKTKTRNKFGRPVVERRKPSKSKTPFERLVGVEERERRRKDRKELVALQSELQAEVKADIEERKRQAEERRKRREANEERGLGFQVINDTKKIKKMKRKVRSKIIHMPAEHFEKYLQTHRRQFE